MLTCLSIVDQVHKLLVMKMFIQLQKVEKMIKIALLPPSSLYLII